MGYYYSAKLSAERMKRCYDLAPPRVRTYFEAELQHVLSHIRPSDKVLELGCGYGRVLQRIGKKAKWVVGIDTSRASLDLARELGKTGCGYGLAQMNAVALGFHAHRFDLVVCIQNGISAFRVDPLEIVRESLRVTHHGGLCLFSSYSDKFWEDRLEWFKIQSSSGLLGEIDWDATKNGVIVCKDGFEATTFGPQEFASLAAELRVDSKIVEVDESSIFCEILVK